VNAWHQALATVNSCIEAGVREFVVCAGARNAGLLEALARAESAGLVRVWHHSEERSAGFFALGRTMETGMPCAVVTTSGTAAAELLPAMIEGHYQARPLIAITADRPAKYRGSGAPQAIEQAGIFGVYAAVAGFDGWDGRQPLHLNVELEEGLEFGDETFAGVGERGEGQAGRLSAITGETPVLLSDGAKGAGRVALGEFKARWERPDVAALARWLRTDWFRGLVVLVGGLEPDEREAVFHFCQDLGAPVMAEATSGLREALWQLALPDGDRWLKANPPAKVLRLGEVPSGRFWRDLEDLTEISVVSVCRNGLPGLARESQVVRGPVDRVLAALGGVERIGDVLDYLPQRSRRAERIAELLEAFPDSEPGLLRVLSQYASLGGGVFLGNSLPIREWNLFAQWQQPVPSVRANRGANGIDGQLSTWLGWSAEVSESWAVVGDLTALYDLAAGSLLGQVECRGRVLAVVNNGGGRIFDRLPRLAAMSPRAVEWMLNAHRADMAGFAALWGMKHLRVRTADDFDQVTGDEAATVLLELLPDPVQTRRFWAEWDSWETRSGG
jgi:2-succinyl-5-enolpyruvyl-6-hydroxy-3-cyclohexene-1-carboxylate synthase